MRISALSALLLAGSVLSGIAADSPPPPFVAAKARITEIAATLPAESAGVGAPAGDRARGKRAAASLPTTDIISAARQAAATPVPALPDDLYLAFSRTGNRTDYQQVNQERLSRLQLFAWAEALQHRGEFVPALERELAAILDEKTWVLPAHDGKLANFEGRVVEIDLGVAMRAWCVATAAWWHADQLAPATLARTRAELRRRVIDPFLALARGGPATEGMWWNRASTNWNAVCHAGVLGTALTMVPSVMERAEIIATAELDLEYYLAGFTPDGYCSEGVGYWNYGFGHFAMLSEVLGAATQGKVRPLFGEHAARIAAYPAALEIIPGIYPAFADMNVKERPLAWFGALAVKQFFPQPLGLAPWPLSVSDVRSQLIYEAALKVFVPLQTAGRPPAPAPRIAKPSYWFKDAQVYVGRATATFGAAIKGGHNAENHNHNDLGSYVVAAGDRAALVDPGLEIYTARTFGPHRYESKVLNSYGHPVPVVAGQLQHEGREFAAKVISASFGEKEDSVVLDLTRGYVVPVLKSLTRTFTLRRQPRPEIVITDAVEYAEPAAFETALVTFEKWRERQPGALAVGEGDAALRVEVTVAGSPWTLRPELITEDLPSKRQPTRLGISLTAPVRTATVSVRISPR